MKYKNINTGELWFKKMCNTRQYMCRLGTVHVNLIRLCPSKFLVRVPEAFQIEAFFFTWTGASPQTFGSR